VRPVTPSAPPSTPGATAWLARRAPAEASRHWHGGRRLAHLEIRILAACARHPCLWSMSGFVKGFRTPASHWHDEILGGRGPKSLKGGNRGEFAPAVVSVYGDLAPAYELIFGLRTGTTAEQLPRRGFWSPCAGSERWSRGERSAFWRSKAALTVAVGGEWPSAMRYRPGTGAAMWDDGRSVLVMNCRSRLLDWATVAAGSRVRKSRR
jgi:hypothetical protein